MSSSVTPPSRPNDPGTHAVGGQEPRRRGVPVWLWAIAAIIAVVVLLLILRACSGGSSKSSSSSTAPVVATGSSTPSATVTDTDTNTTQTTSGTTTAPPATTPAATTPAATTPAVPAPAAGGAGTLDVAGKNVLPLNTANGSTGALTAFAGKPAAATSVVVQSVPVDNGFWIGTSATNRVWVQLLQEGLVSPHPVRVGDHVTFAGTMVANPASFAQTAGLTPATGAAQLTAQGVHVQAAKTSIVFK